MKTTSSSHAQAAWLLAEIETGNRYCHTSCLRDEGTCVSFVESENRLLTGEGERMLVCNVLQLLQSVF